MLRYPHKLIKWGITIKGWQKQQECFGVAHSIDDAVRERFYRRRSHCQRLHWKLLIVTLFLPLFLFPSAEWQAEYSSFWLTTQPLLSIDFLNSYISKCKNPFRNNQRQIASRNVHDCHNEDATEYTTIQKKITKSAVNKTKKYKREKIVGIGLAAKIFFAKANEFLVLSHFYIFIWSP